MLSQILLCIFIKVRDSKSKTPPVIGDIAYIHSSQLQGADTSEVVQRDNASARRKFRVKVAFSYYPETGDELKLEVDDIIDVVGQPENGWWEGVVNCHKGVFPSNYVSALEDDENNMEVTDEKTDQTDGASLSGESETKG